MEIKRFFKQGDLFLSLPPVGQVIKMTCKQHCGKEQLTVLGGEGRWYLWCVINSEGVFGQYPNKYSKKKLPDSHNSAYRLVILSILSVI